MSESVLRGTFNSSLSLRRWWKASKSVLLLQSRGWGTRRIAWVESVMRTGEWSEESSRQDFASVKSQGILLVTQTQKSTRSSSLFRSFGQYVSSPEVRCLKLLLSNILSNIHPRGDVSRDHDQSLHHNRQSSVVHFISTIQHFEWSLECYVKGCLDSKLVP
jgi:hypothetical protein